MFVIAGYDMHNFSQFIADTGRAGLRYTRSWCPN